MRYSYSRIETFKTCPLKFKYTYIDKIERPTESIEAFVGSRVHEVLEKLYKDLKIQKLNTLDELTAFYSSIWDKNWHDDIKIVKKDYTKENYFDVGADCVKKYYSRHQPFNHKTTLGTEIKFALPFATYQFTGVIDRLDQADDGIYEIHDYKTSGFLPDQISLDEDRQLALYHLAIKDKFEDVKDVELIWHYLVFDKEFRSKRTDDQLEELRVEVIKIIEEIEKSKEFLPKESALCEWCEFQDMCPKRKHYVKVNGLEVDNFLNETGVALVNRYANLEVKKKEVKDYLDKVDDEITRVKNALINYREREGVDVVKGSDKKARIVVSKKTSFPLKNDPRRGALDKLIRESGKWDAVSDLNPWQLAKVLDSPAMAGDLELIENIKSYGKEEQDIRVYLSELSEREK